MVNKRLGDVVKQERLKLNLSQNALAEQAKVSLRTVSDIETYNGNPRLDTLYALANYLHISIDAVFSDKKSNMDSTMQQIIAELNSCPEEQKQLALSTLRGEYSCAVTPQVRQTGNRLSGLAGTAYASLLT